MFWKSVEQPQQPPSTPIIDDFEYATQSGFEAAYGDTSGYSLVTSPVAHGSQALEGGGGEMTSTGLQNTPTRGDIFEFYIQFGSSNGFPEVHFAVNGANTGYYIYFNDSQNNIHLTSDGSTEDGDYDAVTLQTGIFYRCLIDFDSAGDGTITATLFDETDTQVAVSTMTNTSAYNGGQISFTDYGTTIFDYFVHTDGSDTGGGGPTITTIESWEDQSLTNWYNEPGDFTFNTSNAYDGSVSLSMNVSGEYSKLGTSQYPTQQGQKLRMAVSSSKTAGDAGYAQTELVWAVQGQAMQNMYGLRYEFSDNQLILYEISGGGRTALDIVYTSISYTPNTWLILGVDWQSNGQMQGFVFDDSGSVLAATGTRTDTTYTSGDIGFITAKGSNSDTILVDYLHEVP